MKKRTAKQIRAANPTMGKGFEFRIVEAQTQKRYLINGKVYNRLAYGKDHEGFDTPDTCHDCGVIKGELHVPFLCDMEECPRCHNQLISCDCDIQPIILEYR